jgi:putative acetyltransferase
MPSADAYRTHAAFNGISLRRREARDAEALFCMFSQPLCQLGMVLKPFSSPEELQAWLESKGSGNFEAVATVDDQAIGYSGLFACEGMQDHVGSMSLFVHDDFHSRGIGTLMMKALLATADVLIGLRRVQLIVFCDNEPAIALYRKFDFQIEGRLECFVRRGDDFLPAYTMARLTAGDRAATSNMARLINEGAPFGSARKPIH